MRFLTIFFMLLFLMPVTQAAVFSVDTTDDANLAFCTAAPNDCSLRGAINLANLSTELDTIEFDIPQSDAGFQPTTSHWRISVGNTALPVISEPVVIDGLTQGGASANTNSPTQGGLNSVLKIELTPGSGFGPQQNGLDTFGNNFAAAASTFRGLVINRFFSQIQLAGSAAHRIENCYLGTDINGSIAAVNTISGRGTGVRVQGPGPYQIGGPDPSHRNLLSGLSDAVVQQSSSDAGLTIRGNLFGTNAAGTAAIANTSIALNFNVGALRNARIGGSDTNDRNVISASHFWAISFSAQGSNPFSGTLIEGNFIGTDWTGTQALGNGLNPNSPSQVTSAIRVGGTTACNLIIGGTSPGQANLIAYSGKQGIENDQCKGIQGADNIFIKNRDVAFDNVVGGGSIGATLNDANDVDDFLGNRGQNYPELTLDAVQVNGEVNLNFAVDSALANASYPLTVKIYRASEGGGPVAFIDEVKYATPNSVATLTIQAGGNLPLTAVAIDADGNQSEFAPTLGENIFSDGFE